MKDSAEAKSVRLLTIYSRLVNGELLVKSELAEQHHVSNRVFNGTWNLCAALVQISSLRKILSTITNYMDIGSLATCQRG